MSRLTPAPGRGRWCATWLVVVSAVVAVPADARVSAWHQAHPFGIEAESARVNGTVADTTGGVLVGATVTLHHPGLPDQTTATDADGAFKFEGLRPGDYELTASLSGFAPVVRPVRASASQTQTVALTMSVQVAEQFVVTAAKTGEQDVRTSPVAITALGGGDLERLQSHTIRDLAGRAPAVTFSQNSGFSQLTIRGIGTNAVFAGSDPSSAVYVDGVYLARPASLLSDFVDLERVEVLRGPQGTLYGRNAMGGALNVITRGPTNELEASARLVVGDRDTLRAEGRVSGPIVKDKVLASAAVLRGVRDGYVRDLNHPDHPLGGEDVFAARGKLQIIFNRRSDLLLSADVNDDEAPPLSYVKVLAVKPGFTVDNPRDLHQVRMSTLAEGQNLQYGTSARLNVRVGPDLTLTSLTAYRTFDYDLVVDADVTELDLTVTRLRERQRQLSEELTLAGARSRLSWIGGLFALSEADHQPTDVDLGGPRLQNLLDPDVDARSAAIFGQATLSVTRRMSATAGLRYTNERKSIHNIGYLSTLDPPVTRLPATFYDYEDTIEHDAWTPKFGVELHASEHTFAYASATRGFKSGGFNLTSPVAGRGFAPEWAWSYEAGVKTRSPRGGAWLNTALFHTDYRDLQVQTAIRPGVIDISNAAEATIRGVEVEGATRLSHRLQLGGHVAWLDATYDRYVAVGVGGVTGDVAGKRLNNAPEWSGRMWLDWTREIAASLVSCRVESTWQSVVFFTPFNDAIQRQNAFGTVDAIGEIGPRHRRWSLGVYARNLTGEDYITGSFSSPPPAIGGRPADGRRFGLQLTLQQ